LANGQFADAKQALKRAARSKQNPDANLLRRARVALAEGDRHSAMAKIRRLVHLYPTEGTFLWFYSTLLHDKADERTFEIDMDQAIARLHPALRPYDFMVAAYDSLGKTNEATRYMKLGIERDCGGDIDRPNRDNCLAWYNALAGRQQAESLERIKRALAAKGDRSDFLDTRAMVHLSRGELDEARDAAVAAARLDPDDIYMLWQAERIAAMGAESAQEDRP
jgi:tetratricopeptide (TPR) repeat protein